MRVYSVGIATGAGLFLHPLHTEPRNIIKIIKKTTNCIIVCMLSEVDMFTSVLSCVKRRVYNKTGDCHF